MFATALIYLIPGGVSVYGVIVMITGDVGGFGSRRMRGTAARLVGLLLTSALPMAVVLGPMVHISILVPKTNHADQLREAEITREILHLHRELSEWQAKNRPSQDAELKEGETNIERLKERTRAAQEFNVEYKKRIDEKNAHVEKLKEEQTRLRGEREAGKSRRQAAASRNGAMWVGAAVWTAAWLIATLFGRSYEMAPPNSVASPPGDGS